MKIGNFGKKVSTAYNHPEIDRVRDSTQQAQIKNRVDYETFTKEMDLRAESNYAIAERFRIVEGTQRELIRVSEKNSGTLEAILLQLQRVRFSQADTCHQDYAFR